MGGGGVAAADFSTNLSHGFKSDSVPMNEIVFSIVLMLKVVQLLCVTVDGRPPPVVS